MRVTKMSGAGNLFAVVPFEDAALGSAAKLSCLCGPSWYSTDGLMIIGPPTIRGDVLEASIDFVNADGSPAEFCGNGARCAARFLFDRHEVRLAKLRFPGHRVTAVERGDRIELTLPLPEERGPVDCGIPGAVRIDAGVPHLVVRLESDLGATARAQELTRLKDRLLADDPDWLVRSNLTVVSDRAGGMGISTWERGAGPTQACGSAALCAAAFARSENASLTGVAIWPPSGDELLVEFDVHEARLIGPAIVLFDSTATSSRR